MKLLLLLTIMCSAYLYVEAAKSYELPNPKRKLGGCYSEDLGHMVKNQKLPALGVCTQAICNEDGTIVILSCGVTSASPPCKIVQGDLNKPYPDCCPRDEC